MAFPKDNQTPVPKIFEYVTLHGKRDFADVDNKVKDFEKGRLLWVMRVGQWNHNVILKSGRRKQKRRSK